ncbi:hypothetical protein [Pseudomonas phage D6]|nr:hypothetical protein [Pseudomonas phage D6]
MSAVNRLNKYPPGTIGFVLVGSRYKRWWLPAVMGGRCMGMYRRVIAADGDQYLLEHEEQFSLVEHWKGERTNLYSLSKI